MSLAGILYAYLLYPLAIWALARLCPRPHRASPIKPSVSIVLAVHNGIDRIAGKIQHLLNLDYSEIKEIVVVSDGSTDGTAEFLKSLDVPKVKTVVLTEHGGKAVAVNAGVELASGEVILFVDIRPEVPAGAIERLVSNFADPSVGCVAGELILKQDGHDAASEVVGGLYWRYEQWIRKCEAAFDSPVGVYGGFYAIRRKLFTSLPSGIILDDMFQPLSIIRQGYRSVLDANALVYDVWPKKVKGEFHRKVRTLAGNFQLFRMAPWSLTSKNRTLFQLISHKAMRLVVPYLLVLLLVSSVVLSFDSRVFFVLTLIQALSWAAAIGALRYTIPVVNRLISPLSALLVLNAAAVIGFYKFLFTRGPLWKIWTSSKPELEVQSPHQRNAESDSPGSMGVMEIDESSLVQK